jgi:hypothetical protein
MRGVGGQVAVGNERGEERSRVARHFLVDPLKPFDEAAGVVLAVAILPDVVDHFGDRAARLLRRFAREGRSGAEILQERAVEAIEDREMRFVREALAEARAAAEHLLEQDAAPHRPQEDDVLQIGYVHPGRE